MVSLLQNHPITEPLAILGFLQPIVNKKFYIETFGCQMNVHDSEKIAGILYQSGYERAEGEADAGVFIINTCSVRARAERKFHGYLARLGRRKKDGADITIGIAGCVAQQEGNDLLARNPFIDFIIGTHQVHAVAEVLKQIDEVRAPRVQTGMTTEISEVEPFIAKRSHPGRAFITVQEGCNKFCAFCVVPFTRGRERCRTLENILIEARYLAEQGYGEIQILGQNVNCWAEGGNNFIDLLKSLDTIHVKWLRFVTSHPAHFTEQMVEWMGQSKKLCPQLHLPVQSGSNQVLERMRRDYTCEQFLSILSLLRRCRPGMAISTDIIVGFPGETDEDFAKTTELCAEVGFDSMFSFAYSPRKYSLANRWVDDVPVDVKRRRLMELQALQRQIQIEKHKNLIGDELVVLIDGPSKKATEIYSGHSGCNRVVNFISAKIAAPGQFARVRITNSGPNSLFGKAID